MDIFVITSFPRWPPFFTISIKTIFTSDLYECGTCHIEFFVVNNSFSVSKLRSNVVSIRQSSFQGHYQGNYLCQIITYLDPTKNDLARFDIVK